MNKKAIDRIDYRETKKKLDFEIVDIQRFFATRPHHMIERDFRLNFWVIFYITAGQGQHYVDFVPYDYKAGDIIFVQKNQVNGIVINQKVQGYIININEPFFYGIEGLNGDIFLDFVDRAYGSPLLSVDTGLGQTNRTLIDLLYKEYRKKAEEINEALIASIFQGFILSLKGLQGNKDQTLFQTKDYENFRLYRSLVEVNFHKTRQVEDYGVMMHLSKKTINQATRRVVGLSAKQFIINRTLLEIKRYLSQGELMNYEIADLLGFGDAASMTKFFKHYEGQSPKAFRQAHIGH